MKTRKIIICGNLNRARSAKVPLLIIAVIVTAAFGACAAKGQKLTGTDSFKFDVINDGTAYSVSAGTATEGTVDIPAYYRPDSKSKYLPVKRIGSFRGKENITSVTIPSTVTSIGEIAFYECTGLTSVTIPKSVTSIGNGAFSGCTNLTGITVAASNPNYASQDGILYNKAKTEIITVPEGISGSITIPAGVTSIDKYAFVGRENLTSVTIPSTVTSIGEEAFLNCENLTSITIPEGVASIGDAAFGICTSLTSITIPSTVTHIANNMLNSCINLASVTIPASVTSIGYRAFEDCTNLTSITIPASVTSIDRNAFAGWTASQTINVQGKASQAAADAAWGYRYARYYMRYEGWRYGCNAKIVYQGQ